jgi:hypothetical protein
MKWGPKIGVTIALLAGLVAAVYLVWTIGFDAIFASITRAGFGGLALLCLYALTVFVALALAWFFLLPPAQRRPIAELYIARLVRDSIAEISPFSPVGGMVAAARLLILKGMDAAYAAASVAADATTEAMAQVVFLAFGLGIGFNQFRHLQNSGPLTEAMIVVLLLGVPGIALLIFLQKRGAGFAEKMAARFFPQIREGISFRAAIEELYDSPSRLAVSAAFHLLAWIGSGGGTFIAFRLVGGHINLVNAVALEALHHPQYRRLRAGRHRGAGGRLCHAGAAVRTSRRNGAGCVAAQAGAGNCFGGAGAGLLAKRREPQDVFRRGS